MEREDITKELTGVPLTGLPSVVEDRREVDDERQRGQQQEIAAAAEIRQGRSTGPVDRHAQHARGLRSVDRPVDRQSGLGENLMFQKSGYLRLLV